MSRKAVVIGGGHNGLIAALVLAQRGHSVRLFERRSSLGGVSAPWHFGEYEVPGLLHETSCLSPRVCEALNLTAQALKMADSPEILVPDRQGQVIGLRGQAIQGDVLPSDLANHRHWIEFLRRVKPVLERQMSGPPPSLELSGKDLLGLGATGLSIRLLARIMQEIRIRVDWGPEKMP